MPYRCVAGMVYRLGGIVFGGTSAEQHEPTSGDCSVQSFATDTAEAKGEHDDRAGGCARI